MTTPQINNFISILKTLKPIFLSQSSPCPGLLKSPFMWPTFISFQPSIKSRCRILCGKFVLSASEGSSSSSFAFEMWAWRLIPWLFGEGFGIGEVPAAIWWAKSSLWVLLWLCCVVGSAFVLLPSVIFPHKFVCSERTFSLCASKTSATRVRLHQSLDAKLRERWERG